MEDYTILLWTLLVGAVTLLALYHNHHQGVQKRVLRERERKQRERERERERKQQREREQRERERKQEAERQRREAAQREREQRERERKEEAERRRLAATPAGVMASSKADMEAAKSRGDYVAAEAAKKVRDDAAAVAAKLAVISGETKRQASVAAAELKRVEDEMEAAAQREAFGEAGRLKTICDAKRPPVTRLKAKADEWAAIGPSTIDLDEAKRRVAEEGALLEAVQRERVRREREAATRRREHEAERQRAAAERALFGRFLFPELPSAMRTSWVAEKAALPAKLRGGIRAAQALLGKACWEGDLGAVKRAVAAGADPNAQVYNEGKMNGTATYTAAATAAYKGNVRELRFLLVVTGADPNLDTGKAPPKRDELTAKDYNYGDGRSSSSGKDTPCFQACRRHRHKCVRVLLALGATPDHSRETGYWNVSKGVEAVCTCPCDIER